MPDKLIGTAFTYDCHLGFHAHEPLLLQRVRVDFEVEGAWRAAALADEPAGIVDYFEVNRAFAEHVSRRSWKLVEALAEDLARVLCTRFPVSRARVRVTKVPYDMPNVGAVAVECERVPADFAGG
jgi:dihydroneopterin aldolase